jgi:hypothetical protein
VGVADDGPLLLAECKWTDRPMGLDVLGDLRAKVAALVPDLERPPSRVDLALFSRSGFTADLEREAGEKGVLLVTAEEVVGTRGASG